MGSIPQPGVLQSHSIKQRIVSGEGIYGAMLCSASPVVAEIVGHAGYDLVFIDMDHGPGGSLTSLGLMQAVSSTGTGSVLRVQDSSPLHIQKALDSGPAGILVPMVDSAETAKKIVSSCRYPPEGTRSCAPSLIRASQYGFNTEYPIRLPDEAPLVMAQIESELAVGRIPEIAAVEGIDCLFISPVDLSASIGRLAEQTNEEALRLIRRAEEAILTSGKLLGGFVYPTMTAQDMFARGYSFVVGAIDIAMIREAAKADIVKVKGSAAARISHAPPVLPFGAMRAQHELNLRASAAGRYNLSPGGPTQMLLPRVPLGGHLGMPGVNAMSMLGVAQSPFGVSRRGGRGTPKRCSQCHKALKEGHADDCPVLEKKKRMRVETDGAVSPVGAAAGVANTSATAATATSLPVALLANGAAPPGTESKPEEEEEEEDEEEDEEMPAAAT